MSQQANIQLYDGQATPVLKTFSVAGADRSLAVWEDRSSGVRIGLPTITMGNHMSGNGAKPGAFKLTARITVPVLETLSGDAGGYVAQPQVAFNMFASVTLVAPARCGLQHRKDLWAFTQNLLGHAVPKAAFVDYDVPF